MGRGRRRRRRTEENLMEKKGDIILRGRGREVFVKVGHVVMMVNNESGRVLIVTRKVVWFV